MNITFWYKNPCSAIMCILATSQEENGTECSVFWMIIYWANNYRNRLAKTKTTSKSQLKKNMILKKVCIFNIAHFNHQTAFLSIFTFGEWMNMKDLSCLPQYDTTWKQAVRLWQTSSCSSFPGCPERTLTPFWKSSPVDFFRLLVLQTTWLWVPPSAPL